MRSVSVALWILSFVSGLCSAMFMVVGLSQSGSTPEQAAIGALGSAWAVVPYVLARSWDEMTKKR